MGKIKGLISDPVAFGNKLLDRSDVIAGIVTFFANTGGLEGISANIRAIIERPLIPDPNKMVGWLWGGIGQALPFLGIGMFLSLVDIEERWARRALGAGLGIVGGNVAAGLLTGSHNPGGIGGTQTGTSTAGLVTESYTGRASYPAPATTSFGTPQA